VRGRNHQEADSRFSKYSSTFTPTEFLIHAIYQNSDALQIVREVCTFNLDSISRYRTYSYIICGAAATPRTTASYRSKFMTERLQRVPVSFVVATAWQVGGETNR
jgi:hypothetical protein